MKYRALLLAGGLLLGSCATTAAHEPAGAGQPIDLVDLTDEFAATWERDKDLPGEERATRFKADFARLLPGFYSHERVGVDVAKYDGLVISALENYPQKRAGIEEVSRRFSELLRPAQESFRQAFGSF